MSDEKSQIRGQGKTTLFYLLLFVLHKLCNQSPRNNPRFDGFGTWDRPIRPPILLPNNEPRTMLNTTPYNILQNTKIMLLIAEVKLGKTEQSKFFACLWCGPWSLLFFHLILEYIFTNTQGCDMDHDFKRIKPDISVIRTLLSIALAARSAQPKFSIKI